MGEIRGFLRSNSHPLIARQLERILNQFHNNYNIPLNQTQPMDFELEQKIQKVANTLISNGIDGFLNGLIPTNLIACQQEYFQTQSNKPPDICTWTQSLIELLHSHALNIWKKRSKFLHENISRSHENHIREEAYKTLLALRAYPSKLPASLRHLTKRTRWYFRKTNIRNLNAWSNRVKVAISTKTRIDNTGSKKLRKWYKTSQRYVPDFKKDNPDYDIDAAEEFYTHFPDEHKDTDTWDQLKFITSFSNSRA